MPNFESQKRSVAFMFNGKLPQIEEYCLEHLRIDSLEAQRQDQDELHKQDCSIACQHEIQTWNHAGIPCACCEKLEVIARLLMLY